MPEKNNDNTLKMAVRAFTPFETALEKAWEAYCKKTGCTLQLQAVPMDLGELHEEILEKEGLKKGRWDIAHLNTDWVREAFVSGALLDLAPFIRKNPPEAYPDGWSGSLLKLQKFGKKIVGLPFHDGPECLIYRTDLFEDPWEQEDYFRQFDRELRPPRTWDEFVQVARFFQRPDRNLYGSVFAAFPDGHNTVFDFCLQLWTRGGDIIDDNGNITIHTQEAAEGLEFYRALLKDTATVHPKCSEFDSVGSGVAFLQGEVAMMVNWFGFASLCEVHKESRTKGNVNVAPIPRGASGGEISLNVYWLYTIGSGSSHKSTAYDFIRFAVSASNDKQLTMEGGIGCRLSTWSDPEVNDIVPYYHRLEELHRKARTLPRHDLWSQIAAIIDQVVLRVLNTNLPVPEILKKGQEKIDKLLND